MYNFGFDIEYLDFTFDPIYMLIKSVKGKNYLYKKGEIVLFDLKSVNNLKDLNADENNIYVDSDIEW